MLLLLLPLLWTWGWIRHASQEDPWPLLNRGPAVGRILTVQSEPWATSRGEARRRLVLTLDGQELGTIRAAVSLPAEGTGPWPVMLVMGGFEADVHSLDKSGFHGPCALVAYGYPGTPQAWQAESPAWKVRQVRRAALAVAGQVSALLGWVAQQPWADRQRICVTGFSLGAIFAPSVVRLTEARGQTLGPTVLAYGGADLASLFDANVRVPRLLRAPARAFTCALLHPIEPALHLPYLKGDALIVQGSQDRFIPPASARAMVEAKPHPRTVIQMDTGHLDPGDPAFTERIIDLSRAWLAERGMLPPVFKRGDEANPSVPAHGTAPASPPRPPAGR